MDTPASVIAAWQIYFATLAAACATLAGLLFLSLSLHMAALREPTNANLRRLASHTLENFISILFIGLFFLVPKAVATFYGIATLVTVAFGITSTSLHVRATWRDKESPAHRKYFLTTAAYSALSYFAMAAGGLGLLLHATRSGFYYMVLSIFVGTTAMLISTLRRSWYILAHQLR